MVLNEASPTFEIYPNNQIKDGWQDETSQRGEVVKNFLVNYFNELYNGSKEGRRDRYDGSELHFSGSNGHVMEKIKIGEAKIIETSVLYQKGEITQIHVAFDNEGQGHIIDVYLTKKALEDFLKESE